MKSGVNRVPESGLANRLGRLEQEGGGHGEAERLDGLEVDDEVELRRLLDGQLRWSGPFQDAIHVGGGAAQALGHAWPIRHEAARVGKLPLREHRGQAVLGGQGHHPGAVIPQHGIRQRDESLSPRRGQGRKEAVQRVGMRDFQRIQLDAQAVRGGLEFAPLGRGGEIAGTPEDGDARDLGQGCLEEFEPFAAQPWGHDA